MYIHNMYMHTYIHRYKDAYVHTHTCTLTDVSVGNVSGGVLPMDTCCSSSRVKDLHSCPEASSPCSQ